MHSVQICYSPPIYFLRLDIGEELIKSISNFTMEHSLAGGAVMALGAVKDTALGAFNPEKKAYSKLVVKETRELVGLTGTIAWLEGKPMVHIHAVLSDEHGASIAGHIFSATVAAAAEIIIFASLTKIERSLDPAIGLPLLQI